MLSFSNARISPRKSERSPFLRRLASLEQRIDGTMLTSTQNQIDIRARWDRYSSEIKPWIRYYSKSSLKPIRYNRHYGLKTSTRNSKTELLRNWDLSVTVARPIWYRSHIGGELKAQSNPSMNPFLISIVVKTDFMTQRYSDNTLKGRAYGP